MLARIALAAVLGFTVALVGCSHKGPLKFEKPPVRVVCTTTIVADVVKRVGGDRVEVESLMGPGVDPHQYIATPGDKAKFERAHIVFYNGLHLEGKMVDLFEKNKESYRAFAITRDLPEASLRSVEIDGGSHDPHVWFDVLLWMQTLNVVRDELAALDPDGAEHYRANAEAYRAELAALHDEITEVLNRVPKERRFLVTSHDAFGYFGDRYRFEVHGLQGVSTASEAGTRDTKALSDLLGRNKIPAVFTETSVPEDGLKSVLETCRKDWKHEVKLIGDGDALYSDALGEPGSPGGTYPGMIRHNAKVIVDALGK